MARPETTRGFATWAVVHLVIVSLLSCPAWGLTCSDQDIDSKNAEKCARKYAREVRKCLKKGIPLAICNTTTSDRFCNVLSAGCSIREEVDLLVGAVYDLSTVPALGGCSQPELDSDDSAECAASYAAAFRRCIKKSIPLDKCDTPKAETKCAALTPTCSDNLRQAAQATALSTNTDSHCQTFLFSKGSKVISRRFKAARKEKGAVLYSTLAKAIEKAGKKCAPPVAVPPPCDDATTPEDLAACVLSGRDGCTDITPDDLVTLGGPPVSALLAHAAGLGYVSILRAAHCSLVGSDPVLSAVLAADVDDYLILLHVVEDGGPSVLLPALPDFKSPIVFNEGGGFEISPRGDLLLTDPMGVVSDPIAAGLQRSGAPPGQCRAFWDYAACKAAFSAIQGLACAGFVGWTLDCSVVFPASFSIGNFIGALGSIGLFTGCVSYGAPLLAGCLGKGVDTPPETCDEPPDSCIPRYETCASSGECKFGICTSVPKPEIVDKLEMGELTNCNDEFDGIPRCHVLRQSIEIGVCNVYGDCQAYSEPCPDGYLCVEENDGPLCENTNGSTATPTETPTPTPTEPTPTPTATPSNTPTLCGNGQLDPAEQCDDGDLIPGDGCDENCQEECAPDPTNPDGGSCELACVPPNSSFDYNIRFLFTDITGSTWSAYVEFDVPEEGTYILTGTYAPGQCASFGCQWSYTKSSVNGVALVWLGSTFGIPDGSSVGEEIRKFAYRHYSVGVTVTPAGGVSSDPCHLP